MSTKSLLSVAGAVVLSMTALSAQASPFSFEYNDTVSYSFISGVSAGDAAKITVTLDNGGSSLLSQTWTAANLQSIVFDFGNGALHTTFTSPFDGGLVVASGNFVTNASGVLTSVQNGWSDFSITTDFTTNGPAPGPWFLDGLNSMYIDTNFNGIGLTNIGSVITASAWSPVTQGAVPAPATAWLLLAGLAGFGRFGKRRAA